MAQGGTKMQDWESKLNKFLETWAYMDHTIGILVCGSYITGDPDEHSDLDVHIILDEQVAFRERGNRYVDGLLIEYFANTPNQIRQYFKEDYQAISQMSQTQFATGSIVLDKDGEVQKLKDEAIAMINRRFEDISPEISELHKYALWDALDDLQAIYKAKRNDFDFIYFVNLDMLIGTYMKLNKLSYDKKQC